jgi:type II secretory pathway pseudopilin PulG
MIGTLAVLALLAALLLPAWIKRIDIAVHNQEKLSLGAISNSLVLNVVRSGNVPDQNTWKQQAANWSMQPLTKITANPRHYQRVYYTLENPNPSILPYTQNDQGITQPQRLRAVVVSILGGDALSSGNSPASGPLSDTKFAALWELAEGARPTNDEWASWNGRGDDFLVSRIDYAPMFHRLVLLNRDPEVTPTFGIEATNAIPLPKNSPNTGWDKYYVHGTVVALCDPSGTPVTRYLITRDISFVFEDGKWRAQIMGGTETANSAGDFANQAARFLSASWWTGAAKGADQQTAMVAMYSFMLTYTFWADLCPHFPQRTTSAVNVPEYKLLLDFTTSEHGLDAITGANGLLDK